MNTSSRVLKFTVLSMLLLTGLMGAGQALANECKISLSDANVDFGRIMQPGANDTLGAGNMHVLGKRSITLNAICPKEAKLVLSLRGAQLGEQFKFAKKGNININLSNAQLDGHRVELAKIEAPGSVPTSSGPSVIAVPGDMVIPVSVGMPAQGSVLSIQVEISPIVPVAELRTREATTMESNVSFEVRNY